MTRTEKLLYKINPDLQKGLEIGPLNRPIVTKSMGEIWYVDHATTEEIIGKCESWGTIDVSEIVHVDYVWGENNLKELTSENYPFDYLIASHVIEHVPDLIGWFKEARSVLKTGGILSLAIPDKRFTFDCLRNLTKPADLIEAFFLKSKRPSLKQIFDYKSGFVHRQKDYNNLGFTEKLIYEHSLTEAFEITRKAFDTNQYEDVHCWVFTELSFLELLESLINLDLFDFKIKQFFKRTEIEFIVSLEAMDLNIDKSERIKIQLESISKAKKDIVGIFRILSLDYASWRTLGIIRNIKKKILS